MSSNGWSARSGLEEVARPAQTDSLSLQRSVGKRAPRQTLSTLATAASLLAVATLAALPGELRAEASASTASGREAHLSILAEDRFPPASACRTCHSAQYEEWSVSPHAYAQLSVVFQSMQAAVLSLTNGTNGDFCIRCHTPVGMALGEPVVLENEKRHATSREGITCVSCHRVSADYGRISSRTSIEEGELCQPVFGPSGGEDGLNSEVARVRGDPEIKVVGCGLPGRTIHEQAEQRSFLRASGFCGTCHDVRLVNGFRLEDAFSEYNASPAAARGETCQDCHMALQPGVASEYAAGPAAVVDGVETRVRRRANHMFPGPDYSVIHPGLFPHNPKAAELASMSQWLEFDFEAGWGDPQSDFEQLRARHTEFPSHWRSRAKRRRARKLLAENCELLDRLEAARLAILQQGFRLGEVVVERSDSGGIDFRVRVASGTDGHSVPTGFDADRLLFLSLRVKDAAGRQVYASGDRDPNGDLRDRHSRYVHNGELPRDRDLFNLQSRFLTRNLRGGEREQVLPVNFSPDPLPFLRPESRATGVYGRPRGVRKHKQTLLPKQHRWAHYAVPEEALTGAGPYTADIELVAQMVPVNLVAEVAFMGFEYGMSARDVADRVVAGAQVIWRRSNVPLVSGTTVSREAEPGAPRGALQCGDL